MICDIQQNTTEWLELRKKKVTATDASVLMLINPWTTPYVLWERKLGLSHDQKKTEAMQRGSDLEPLALSCFNRENGFSLSPAVVISSCQDWAMASLDGLDSEKKVAVEIKCNGKANHEKAINGIIPDYYICQMQHQMFCAGLDSIWYYSFDGENGIQIDVKRDNKYIENLLEKELEFYKCMKEFIPPPMTEKDWLIRGDSDWLSLSERYLSVKYQLRNLEEEEKTLRHALVNLSTGKNCIGGGLKLSKIIRKGSIDYKIIQELKSIDLDIFRSDPTVSYRITETKEEFN